MSPFARLAALVTYLTLDAVRGQRCLVPVVLHAALVGVLVVDDHRAAPGPWPVSVLLLHATAAWVATSAANALAPAERDVAVAAAGGPGAVSAATVLAAVVLVVPSTLLAVGAPALAHPAGFPLATVTAALVAHFATATAGVAVGILCARPLVRRAGRSFAVAGVVVDVAVAQPGLPPVGAAARAVSVPSPALGALLPDLGLAVGLLVVAAVASRVASDRR